MSKTDRSTQAAPAVGAQVERVVGRAVPERDNAGALQEHARKGNRARVSVGRPIAGADDHQRGPQGLRSAIETAGKPMTGRKDGHHKAARESARAGGFDSRSLAEIVVKDGVRVPDEAEAFSEFCTVVMQRPDSRERPAPCLLTRRLLVVCFSAPNAFELTGPPVGHWSNDEQHRA